MKAWGHRLGRGGYKKNLYKHGFLLMCESLLGHHPPLCLEIKVQFKTLLPLPRRHWYRVISNDPQGSGHPTPTPWHLQKKIYLSRLALPTHPPTTTTSLPANHVPIGTRLVSGPLLLFLLLLKSPPPPHNDDKSTSNTVIPV